MGDTLPMFQTILSGFENLFVNLLQLVYIINPWDSGYRDYLDESIPYMLLLIVVEAIVQTVQYKRKVTDFRTGTPVKPYHIGEAVSSVITGILSVQVPVFLLKNLSTEFLYNSVLEYSIFGRQLEDATLMTWVVGAIICDFGFYWWHRCCHEVNIMWAHHITHHTPEEMNWTVGFRLSSYYEFKDEFLYIPLAFFGVPKRMYYVHRDMNVVFQFWTHSRYITDLPWIIEYIFNTPKHHLVHHGRQSWCIDTNYGAYLIIWDRMFGTFAQNTDDEVILIGIVHEAKSLNPVWLHNFHFYIILKRFFTVPGIINKLKVLFYGPGWDPVKPKLRLGDKDDVPAVPDVRMDPSKDQPRWSPPLPRYLKRYLVAQTLLMLVIHFGVFEILGLPFFVYGSEVLFVAYSVLAAYSLGTIIDARSYACVVDLFRLACGLYLYRFLDLSEAATNAYIIFHGLSVLVVLYSVCFSTIQKTKLLEKKTKAHKYLLGKKRPVYEE